MDVLEKIFHFIKLYVTESSKIITILICIILLQTIVGFFYTRSLKKNIISAESSNHFSTEQHQSSNKNLVFNQAEIAFILKALNISTDELSEYYQPQLDNINNLIKKKERETDDLKKQLRNNADSENIEELKSRISFTEEQVIFYQAEALFWEQRSKGLRNLITTLGLDSIMAYIAHRDSIENALAKLDPPKVIIPERIQPKKIPTAEQRVKSNNSVAMISSSQMTTISSQQREAYEKSTEGESNRPNTPNSQVSAISQDEMKTLLAKYNFFDYYWNKNGVGFANKFEAQIIKGEPVVLDAATRLMWQQSGSSVAMNFEAAKKWIDGLNQMQLAGYRDWRLPTLKEAMTLVEPVESDLLYVDSLFTKIQNWIWTSDFVADKDCAWVVSFSLGGCRSSYALSTSNYYVRAVRSMRVPLN